MLARGRLRHIMDDVPTARGLLQAMPSSAFATIPANRAEDTDWPQIVQLVLLEAVPGGGLARSMPARYDTPGTRLANANGN